jgi:hypothetical protein
LLPLRAAPYARLARRLIAGPGSLESIAYETEILYPEETVAVPPAVFLPGQIERVRDDPEEEAWSSQQPASREIEDAIASKLTSAPTIAYHIRDCTIFDGSIYKDNYRYTLHPKTDKSIFATKPKITRACNEGALASSYLGVRYFGHWLGDDCTRYILAEMFGTPVCMRRGFANHDGSYANWFDQKWDPIDRSHVHNLTIFQDHGQNLSKRERYKLLRNKLRGFIAPICAGSGIYLRRGSTGSQRSVINEGEIINSLCGYGIETVDISDNIEHVVAKLMGAKIIISLEGSHLSHFIYSLPEDSALLVLEPFDRFRSMYRTWSACMGIRFGFVVGTGWDGGYYFSIDEILKTIDLLIA